MPYIKKTTVAGKTIEVEKHFTTRYHKKGVTRGKNKKPTTECMAEINERNAEKKLRQQINTNFGHGDLHITLTYEKGVRPTPEEAKKVIEKYIRKLRALYKKNGEELKYIAVTEYKRKAIHHHIVINMPRSLRLDDIEELWEEGYIKPAVLDNTGQYQKLANYLIKETSKSFREEGNPCKKRWNASKNLKKPEAKVEVVKANEWRKRPEPTKGYILETDSIREGYHDFTGWPYQCYSMIKIEERKKRRKNE